MFKYFFSFITAFIFFNLSPAQGLVEFSLGSGYQYDIYYSLSEGITAYPERTNWDLSFSTDVYDANIRINSGNGVTLYHVSDDINNWNSITNLPSDAVQLRNSETEWDIGAFVSNADGSLNYGWGNYNPQSQIVQGSSIYVINYDSFSKKIKINSLINGEYNFSVANLDGSNEESININTLNYASKKFVYYSLLTNEVIDREPLDWDIVFTKYEAEYVTLNGQTMPYVVTGGLSNGNSISQYDGFIDFNPEFEDLSFSTDINTIGYDWKEYSGQYTVIPDRAYYVLSQNEQSLFKIVFQSFSGGQSGNMSFLIEELDFNPSSIFNYGNNNFNVYPNPNSGSFNINYVGNYSKLIIQDLKGRVLHQVVGSISKIKFNNLNNGIYFATIITNDNIFVQQIIVN